MVEAPRTVGALGRLVPVGGVVEVSNILAGDRIVSLVEEGTRVAENDELGRLDETFRKADVDLAAATYAEAGRSMDAERATAQAQLDSAKLALQQAIDGAGIEIEAQIKRVEMLRLDQQQANDDLARLEALHQSADSVVSSQELEHQRLFRDKTGADTDSAQATLRQLRQAAEFKKQTAQANVCTAEVTLDSVDKRSQLESLEVQLRVAKERLGRTTITAPISGTVLKLHTRRGESISGNPVLDMADLSKFECFAEVFETDIKHISIGDQAQIRSPAFRGPFGQSFVTGTVKRVGSAMPSRELTPLSPLEPADRHVVQVVVDLSGKTDEMVDLLAEQHRPAIQDKAQALVNLQVEVSFPAGPTAVSAP